jgi:mono/diheme cytochrome c family protein
MNRALTLIAFTFAALGCSSSPVTGSTTQGGGGAGGATVTGGGGSSAATGGAASTTTGPTSGSGSSGASSSSAASTGSGGGGPTVYQVRCASCHGDDATGTLSGPKIRHANIELVKYYVRNGENNIFISGGAVPTDQTGMVGDDRKMTAFTPAEVSDADIVDITTWLDSLPRPADGDGLFHESCEYCHGANMPNKSVSAAHPSGVNYVKPNVNAANLSWATFTKFIRTGAPQVPPTLDPVSRRRYMPPFPDTLISDAEVKLIAGWICGQYPAQGVTIPVTSYCNNIP